MVSWGTGSQQKNCFLTAYHPSFMLCWWVLTAGSLWPVRLVYKSILGVPPFPYSLSNSRASSPPEFVIPFWQMLSSFIAPIGRFIPFHKQLTTPLFYQRCVPWLPMMAGQYLLDESLQYLVFVLETLHSTYPKIKRLLDECLLKR